ncbi:MAG: Smr/MutS family protein, partial [Bacteroidota bacterium]|nr:Smr/MutS family protein [Bacteroidota bacterium]
YYDMTPGLTSIQVEGTYLEPEKLSLLKLSLQTILAILDFLHNRPYDTYPLLNKLSENIVIDKDIVKKIDRIVDDHSNIRNDASTELKRIRMDKQSKQAQAEKKLMRQLKTAIHSGWTAEDAGVTLREGRWVIPILSAHKRKIPGVVQDESSTGQTVYLEPADVIETSNEIRELEYAERREIVRILMEFASYLRPFSGSLFTAYQFLGKIDFLRAKAILAISIKAVMPAEIHDEPLIQWNEALHPLLYLSHYQQARPVVPLTICLEKENRILVISGPNAGGKSVLLKTVCMVQYMLQCGILPPVKEDSEFGIFKNIFLDIGDEQSLENDLSTYTSKLMNIKFFIENLDKFSLFFIDEFGSGTDPALGGAIAEASLEAMNRKQPFGIITTHYSNLKLLAGKLDGIMNGAMLFDSKKMKPLYRLMTGKPGSSFAMEIAGGIGFPPDILEKAKEKIGTSQLDFEKQLQDLEVEKSEIRKKSSELKVADEFLDELIQRYKTMNDDLATTKKEILRNAKEEALSLLKDSNRLIEQTIKEIRESQADKERTKSARASIKELKTKIEGEKHSETVPGSTFQVPRPNPDPDSYRDRTPNPEQKTRSPYQSYFDGLQEKLKDFRLTLDIRGMRADEAYGVLIKYLDDAILLSIPEIRILHGKGNGVLRQITRDYLSTLSEVKNYHDERLESGGSGITVIQLK